MPHLCIVVSGEGRWRVEQHSQHIGLDVADTGSVVAQALEHILDVQAVDLLEALMDQLDGIFPPEMRRVGDVVQRISTIRLTISSRRSLPYSSDIASYPICASTVSRSMRMDG